MTSLRKSTIRTPKVRQFFLLLGAFFFFAGNAPAQDQAAPTTPQQPTVKHGPAVTVIRANDATADALRAKPDIPSRKLPIPALPQKPGCYHTADGKWVEVACLTVTEKQTPPVRPPTNPPGPHPGPPMFPPPVPTIQSTSHPGPMILPYKGHPGRSTTITMPFDWGSVTVSQPNPTAGSETNVISPTVSIANSFSIQTNTNYFTCTTCSAGYPYPNSQAGDNGWVQFVYTQYGTTTTPMINVSTLCVWIMDNSIESGKYSTVYCASPSLTDTVAPVDGPGAPSGQAEVVGYVQCPNISTTTGCTLGVLAHLPWSPMSDWWMASGADLMGLAGNWTNVSGGMIGTGNGSEAEFTNTTIQTTLQAYTCYAPVTQAGATPGSVGAGPGACAPLPTFPPPNEIEIDLRLTATDDWQVSPTAEFNNLAIQPATLSCGYYDCSLSYTSQ